MKRFDRVLRGYSTAQVDALMARIESTLSGSGAQAPITSQELRATRLDVLLQGYDRYMVDTALQEYVRELESRERSGWRPRPETAEERLARLVRRIETAEFSSTRLRHGYRRQEVDGFLSALAASLRGAGPAVSGAQVRGRAFKTVFLSEGYDTEEVDRLLDEVAAALDG